MNRKIQKETESGCEYILPDYMGDIKKLLFSRARAVPVGKFVDEGNLEVSGSVEYELLYADSDNKLTAISTSSDYTEKFDLNAEIYEDSIEESRIGKLKIRVTGPRKISMKAEVETSLTVCESDAFSVEGDVFSDENKPETSTRVINYSSSAFKKGTEREYAELLEVLEQTGADEVEAMLASAEVIISDVKVSDGCVQIKGENIVSAIIKSQAAPAHRIRRAIPFEEKIEAEEAKTDMHVTARGYASSVNIGFSEENGDCSAVANLICEYSVELTENKSCEVIVDAYLTNKETKNKYRESEYTNTLYCGIQNMTKELKFERESLGLSDAKEILAVNAEIRSPSMSYSKSGCEFSAEMMISGVACEANVDGTVTYIPFKGQLPFCENVNIGCQIPDGAVFEYVLSVSDCEPMLDSETLNLQCSVTAKIYLLIPTKLKHLYSSEIVCGQTDSLDKSKITVYYPKSNENLFDIAKKFRTTSEKIAMDNKLSESALSSINSSDSLLGVKKLIIR